MSGLWQTLEHYDSDQLAGMMKVLKIDEGADGKESQLSTIQNTLHHITGTPHDYSPDRLMENCLEQVATIRGFTHEDIQEMTEASLARHLSNSTKQSFPKPV